MSPQDTPSTDALADELRRIVEQAEELLGAAGDSAALGDLKDRVHHTLGAARDKLAGLEREARQRGRRAAAVTESWVRTNPWATLAIGARHRPHRRRIADAWLAGSRPRGPTKRKRESEPAMIPGIPSLADRTRSLLRQLLAMGQTRLEMLGLAVEQEVRVLSQQLKFAAVCIVGAWLAGTCWCCWRSWYSHAR